MTVRPPQRLLNRASTGSSGSPASGFPHGSVRGMRSSSSVSWVSSFTQGWPSALRHGDAVLGLQVVRRVRALLVVEEHPLRHAGRSIARSACPQAQLPPRRRSGLGKSDGSHRRRLLAAAGRRRPRTSSPGRAARRRSDSRASSSPSRSTTRSRTRRRSPRRPTRRPWARRITNVYLRHPDAARAAGGGGAGVLRRAAAARTRRRAPARSTRRSASRWATRWRRCARSSARCARPG